MLYRPEAFEPLTDVPWDEERVRNAIREIVADTDDAWSRGGSRRAPSSPMPSWNACARTSRTRLTR